MELKIIIIFSLLLSAGTTTLLSLHSVKKLRNAGTAGYMGLMVTTTLYSLGYALELHQTTLAGIRFALKIEYLGIASIPAFWLILAIQYTGKEKWLSKSVCGLIFIVPLITMVLHFTNSYHHLFYSSLTLNTAAPFPLAAITRGPWYYINLFYTNFAFILGNILFFRMMQSTHGPFRIQATLMFLTSLIPWSGHIIYQLGYAPYGIDIVPFTLAITGPCFALALFRYRMFFLVPIARDKIFEEMRDPVIVLDNADRIADFNLSAQSLFHRLDRHKIGHPLKTALPALLISPPVLNDNLHREIIIKKNDIPLAFHTSFAPILSRNKKTIGHILTFYDITEQKKLLSTLKNLATTDELTRIYNRRHFMEKSKEELTRARRYDCPTALILIDLDFFKKSTIATATMWGISFLNMGWTSSHQV